MIIYCSCDNVQIYKNLIQKEVSTRVKEYGYDTLIENIKRIIAEKGMKQRVVAERAGFTSQEFSNILNDRRKLLRAEHIPAIADALRTDVNTLYYPPKEESDKGDFEGNITRTSGDTKRTPNHSK